MTTQLDALRPVAPAWRGRTARLRYEATILGIAAFAVPPIVLVSFAAMGLLVREPGRMLTGGLEVGVPLAVGLTGATLLAAEPALELQLATPGGFRRSALRRLGLVTLWAAVLSLAAVAAGRVTHIFDAWPGTTGFADDVLMPLAPLAAFAAWGALLGVALRSRGAAAAAVTSFWLAALAWHDAFLSEASLRAWYPFQFTFAPHATDAIATRLTLLGVTVLGCGILALWLGWQEWLLGAEDR